ncbi:MAG: hypothetical protein ACI9VR_001064 [Cognaticolwellia sp.]
MRALALAALACGLLAAALRGAVLFDDPLAHGYDGWYYVIQTESWAAGAPEFSDYSLVFWLLSALSLSFGAIVGNKIAALFGAGLMAVGGVVAGWRWTQSLSAACVCGLWLAASPLLLGVSSEYLKNALGLVLLPWVLALLAGDKIWERLASLALLILGLFIHKLSGVMGWVLAAGVIGTQLLGPRIRLPRWLLIVGALGALGALGFGVLRAEDLQRVLSMGSGRPRIQTLLGGRLRVGELAELALLAVSPVVLLWRAWVSERERPLAVAGLLLAVLCLAPGLPFGFDLTAWRLMLVGGLPVALMCTLVAASAPEVMMPIVVALLAGLVPVVVQANQDREPDYVAFAANLPLLQDSEKVVAHRGICGQIMAQTGVHCENFQPPEPHQGWTRVVYAVPMRHLGPVAPDAVDLEGPYVMVPEPQWQAFVAGPGADWFLVRDPRNPYRARPEFVYGSQDD